jgi:hypothetical protein
MTSYLHPIPPPSCSLYLLCIYLLFSSIQYYFSIPSSLENNTKYQPCYVKNYLKDFVTQIRRTKSCVIAAELVT